jgi:hypothetical protein
MTVLPFLSTSLALDSDGEKNRSACLSNAIEAVDHVIGPYQDRILLTRQRDNAIEQRASS